MIDAIGGRKFIFAILAVILAFVLVMTNKIDSQLFLTFVTAIGAIYVVGNVTTKMVTNDPSNITTVTTTTPSQTVVTTPSLVIPPSDGTNP